MLTIREETTADYGAVRSINDLAFGQPDEGRIVEKIRKNCSEALSLVAVWGDRIVGHILFSPATVKTRDRQVTGMALGPMAVLPDHQKQGVGAALINDGIKRVNQRRYPFIVVLGHDTYYPRFGFEPASKYGLKPQWAGIPDAAFMVMILNEAEMRGVHGVIQYRKEFSEAM